MKLHCEIHGFHFMGKGRWFLDNGNIQKAKFDVSKSRSQARFSTRSLTVSPWRCPYVYISLSVVRSSHALFAFYLTVHDTGDSAIDTRYCFRSRGRTRDGARTKSSLMDASINSPPNGINLFSSRFAVREEIAAPFWHRRHRFFRSRVRTVVRTRTRPRPLADREIPRPSAPPSPAPDPPFGSNGQRRRDGLFDLPVERRFGRGRDPGHSTDLEIPRPTVPASPAPDPRFGSDGERRKPPKSPPPRLSVLL